MTKSDTKDLGPPPTLRDEAITIVTEWRDEVLAAYKENPSENIVTELYVVNQILALLAPVTTHFQS